MTVTEALVLFIVMLPLAAMPSASVALVVARSVSAGRRSGGFAALGIVAGDLVFVAVALLGVSALAGWLGAFFSVLKYCGGAYLIWFGWRLLTSKPSEELPRAKASGSSLAADFAAGLVLTLGDVKAILFYASLFPAVIDVTTIGVWDIALIAAITAFAVGGTKLVYVVFSSKLVEKLRKPVVSDTPRKLGGLLMMGCGAVLITKA